MVEQLLVLYHGINGVFDVSVSERENKNAKKREKCKSVFTESTESLLSLVGFRDYWTDVCTL